MNEKKDESKEKIGVQRGIQTLWKTEDWWAVWIAFLIIVLAMIFYYSGSTLKPLAVYPSKWSTFDVVIRHFSGSFGNYIMHFLFWIVVFSIAIRFLGFKLKEFIPSFIFVYLFSIIIAVLSKNTFASAYNLEAPLVALILGMIIANAFKMPKWMDTGFRTEFYIKTGIVLLGATLPFTLIIYAGPVAFIQATIVSVTTFLTIFYVGVKYLHLDKRFCSVLGAGGSVCGVSASIAMGAAVGAKKEHVAISITCVIIAAIVMIFVLPFIGKLFDINPGIMGAWIGTSEFADAAGLAAAQQYGLMYESAHGFGSEVAIWTFTLMKVIGRDMWIGLWAFIMSIIAVTRWETYGTAQRAGAIEIWWRFPKFVIGFFAASAIITMCVAAVPLDVYLDKVQPLLIAPVKTLRTWSFIFTFFCIGLTTRFRELTATGKEPWIAFGSGVIVNVILGFLLSVIILGSYWASITVTK
ncbi:MAG: putative sulfate exporter family transporter [Deferribacterota bacterium]|nr:putative sulfate exporter family transporter [Deferribacterota bacterium]